MKPHDGLPQLIAHRGNAAEFPENTLEALESAVALGVRHVEFDVQLTADLIPVVMHDADLQRIAGRAGCVHDLTWIELAGIAFGEPHRFGARFVNVHPVSLSQLGVSIERWPQVTAFVEIKRASLRRFGLETVLRRVSEALPETLLQQCVWISFDLGCVQALRGMTGARIGWVVERYNAATRKAAGELRADFLFGDVEHLPASMTTLWPGPWQWAIYEVRDVETARRCRKLGADFVETMNVRAMTSAYAAAGDA
jgi:glycerophosphoryl diester phosphodiesterase